MKSRHGWLFSLASLSLFRPLDGNGSELAADVSNGGSAKREAIV